MMESGIAGRILSVLSVLALSILLVGGEVGCSRVENAGQAFLTTDPTPAQKGSNTVRVKLIDPAGKPITGAQVTVTFFMPAMPAMNMAEMKTVINGADKGGGMYEGKGDLGSAGIWEATVTARKAGQTIVTSILAVKAVGGG